MHGNIRILIADDHPVVRMGIRHLLEAQDGLTVVGESVDADHTLDMVRRLQPDALLLDVNMPGSSGVEVLRQLSADPGPTRAILLTAGIEKHELRQALRLGARGVVTKDAPVRVLVDAIHAVYNGGYWFNQQTAAMLADEPAAVAESQRQPYGLTARELQVIAAIVEGCTNRDISQSLSISEFTVKRHLTSIFDKLGVSNRLELGLFAIHHRMIAAV